MFITRYLYCNIDAALFHVFTFNNLTKSSLVNKMFYDIPVSNLFTSLDGVLTVRTVNLIAWVYSYTSISIYVLVAIQLRFLKRCEFWFILYQRFTWSHTLQNCGSFLKLSYKIRTWVRFIVSRRTYKRYYWLLWDYLKFGHWFLIYSRWFRP